MNPLIIGLAIYSAIILVVGVRAARLNRTLDDYLLADRKLGPWVAAFSERASGESAWLMIGLPGLAFASGRSTIWVGVGCCLGIAFSFWTGFGFYVLSLLAFIQANRIRYLIMQEMEKLPVDVYVSPSFGGSNLLLTNLTGHPCVVLPNGFNEEGSPVSITVVGKLYGEAEMLLVAKAYQDATDFHLTHPEMFR